MLAVIVLFIYIYTHAHWIQFDDYKTTQQQKSVFIIEGLFYRVHLVALPFHCARARYL